MKIEQQEQKRIFAQMYNEANQLQNADPAAALQIFEEMQSRFPHAEGIAPWIAYLRKRIQRSETAPSTASSTSSPKLGAAQPLTSNQTSHTPSAPSAQSAAPPAKDAAPSAQSAAPSAQSAAPSAQSAAPSAQSAAPSAQSAAPSAQVEIDQDQIKQWVRQAGDAAKEGDRDAAAALFDRALRMLRDGGGPEKTRLKLMEKRLSIKADRAMCIEGANISQETGDLDLAGRFLEIAVRQNPHDLECLRMDVAIARQIATPHRLLSALLKLSDAYEKTGDLVSYDRTQRELRAVRDQM
ncbi:hypothetical protein L6R29_01040 [Myxococcota bacterium]|nr:hypothetical protein [Myxococcota bacterium]